MQPCQNMTNMNIVGLSSGEEVHFDGLPSSSFELLPPDGTVPDSRQQEVNSQFASPHGQASQEFTQGTGNVLVPPSQEAGLTNVTSSIHIQVKS